MLDVTHRIQIPHRSGQLAQVAAVIAAQEGLIVHGRTYLMTDTVGFIRKLPHQLVQAFGATLEETRRADLVLHVVDASNEADERTEMMAAVDEVLEEIGAGERPRMLVMNKIDALTGEQREMLARRFPDAVMVSAATGEGTDAFGERIADEFERRLQDVELLLPYREGARLAELHDIAGDLEREDTPDGVRVHARVPQGVAERFGRFLVVDDPQPA